MRSVAERTTKYLFYSIANKNFLFFGALLPCMDWREKVKAILSVIILIAVAGALYGWPDKIIQLAIE